MSGTKNPNEYRSETTVELRGRDLGDCWMVNLFVPSVMLRSLRGEPIVGIQPIPGQDDGRNRPTYDRGESGRDNFLDKGHVIFVPKVEGWYDLNVSFPTDKGVNEPWATKGLQVQVIGNGDDAKIIGRQYPQMIEAFGGTPIVRNTEASASAVANVL